MSGKPGSGIYMSGSDITSTLTGSPTGTKWHRKCCTVRKPGVLVTRAIALLLLICLTESVSGSCLSYGHSCWGAHGKRSGPTNVADAFNSHRPAAPADAADAAEAWYLSKVLGRLPPNLELVHRSGADGRGIDSDSLSRTDISRLWQLRRVAQRSEDANFAQDKLNSNVDDKFDVDLATAAAAALGNTRRDSSSDDVIITGRGRTDKDRLMQIMREAAEEK